MIHILAKKITIFFFDRNEKYPIEIYIYGIEIILSVIIGTSLILILGLLFGKIIESLIFLFSLSILRAFTGGYHAKNYLLCNIVLCISFIMSLLSYNIVISRYNLFFYFFIFILSLILVIKFVPVMNKNKTISGGHWKYKAISSAIIILELLISFFIYNLLKFQQILIILPTILMVDIFIIIEIIIQKRVNKIV